MRPGRWRLARLPALLACGVVLVAVAGCSGTPPPGAAGPQMLSLAGPPLTGAGVTQSGTSVGQPWSFGSLVLCAHGDVVVQRVRLVHARGPIALAAFGVRDEPTSRGRPLVGNQPGSVATVTGGEARPGPSRVRPCSSGTGLPRAAGDQGSELVVEVERTGPGDGCASALDVDYTAFPRGQGTLRLDLAVGLLEPGSSAPPCT